jgi:MFS family permease
MILLDNSIIFTALPTIRTAMHYSATGLAWVQDACTLVFGGCCCSAPGPATCWDAAWWLIGARALQGIGAAVVAPSSLSLLTASFPHGPRRAKAVALYGATAGIGASLGLVIGGALADWVSWRAGFFLNVPIGAAMILLAPRYLPETARRPGRFDLTGAVCATLGVGALVFGVIHSADASWTSPVTVAALAAGLVLLAVLVTAERRAAQPVMPLRLFGSRVRVGAYLARLLYLGAMIGFFYFGTQYLQGVLGFSAFEAGVAWLSRVSVAGSYWDAVALPMVLVGAGQGLAFAPLTSVGIAGVTADDANAASGMVNTFHQVGMALGLGVLIAASAHAGHSLTAPAAVLTARVGTALTAGSILLVLCLVAVLALILAAELTQRRHTAGKAGLTAAPERALTAVRAD